MRAHTLCRDVACRVSTPFAVVAFFAYYTYICSMDEKSNAKASFYKEFGDYCLDISKLVFGGIILAGIMELDVSKFVLFGVGTAIVLLTAAAGFVFVRLSDSKEL